MSSDKQIFDQQYLYSLNIALCRNFEKVLESLGHEMDCFKNYYASPCPIHQGDNQTALTIYTENEPYGWWLCNTRGCQKFFPKNLIGFIWAYMSASEGWTDSNKKKAKFSECIKYCRSLVGHINVKSLNFKNRIIAESKECTLQNTNGLSRDKIRNNLNIPADFFIKRGFKYDTLDFFDVGIPKITNEMKNRVVVPIYDQNFMYLGCQGRSLDESFPKWKNSGGIEIEKILYNYHNAKDYIKQSKTVVMVEGPADVWRLWEAGIKNCVATLGNFKTQQRILLELSGALNIKCMFDNDDAGTNDYESVKEKCKRLFNVSKVYYGKPNSDPADLTVDEINKVEGLV